MWRLMEGKVGTVQWKPPAWQERILRVPKALEGEERKGVRERGDSSMNTPSGLGPGS